MRVPQIAIAFVLKSLIERWVMPITNRLALLMKMHHILIKQIVRREVDSPSEPLIDNFLVVVITIKITKVGVNGWYEQAIWMND